MEKMRQTGKGGITKNEMASLLLNDEAILTLKMGRILSHKVAGHNRSRSSIRFNQSD
jgi:hypothetical protein